jgi:hypothetical protein
MPLEHQSLIFIHHYRCAYFVVPAATIGVHIAMPDKVWFSATGSSPLASLGWFVASCHAPTGDAPSRQLTNLALRE